MANEFFAVAALQHEDKSKIFLVVCPWGSPAAMDKTSNPSIWHVTKLSRRKNKFQNTKKINKGKHLLQVSINC